MKVNAPLATFQSKTFQTNNMSKATPAPSYILTCVGGCGEEVQASQYCCKTYCPHEEFEVHEPTAEELKEILKTHIDHIAKMEAYIRTLELRNGDLNSIMNRQAITISDQIRTIGRLSQTQ